MSLLSHPASAFHPFEMAAFAERLICGPAMFPAAGHADEATARLSDPNPAATIDVTDADDDARALAAPAIAEGLAAWEADKAIQAADESHLAESRKLLNAARAMLGVSAAITVNRGTGISSSGATFSEWSVMAYHADRTIYGTGAAPAAALDNLLADLRKKYGISTNKSGDQHVEGRAVLLAGYRSRSEVEQFACRIAIDETYLDELTARQVRGVVDLRGDKPRRPAALPAASLAMAA